MYKKQTIKWLENKLTELLHEYSVSSQAKRKIIYYKIVGNRLKFARLVKKKTQKQIADHLNVTFQQIQKYERGVNQTPSFNIMSICQYLDIDEKHIFKYFKQNKGENNVNYKNNRYTQ